MYKKSRVRTLTGTSGLVRPIGRLVERIMKMLSLALKTLPRFGKKASVRCLPGESTFLFLKPLMRFSNLSKRATMLSTIGVCGMRIISPSTI
jgi:hypothetical protein